MSMIEREKKIDELEEVLCSLWGGGGGYGVYTVAIARDRLRPLLRELLLPDAALKGEAE